MKYHPMQFYTNFHMNLEQYYELLPYTEQDVKPIFATFRECISAKKNLQFVSGIILFLVYNNYKHKIQGLSPLTILAR